MKSVLLKTKNSNDTENNESSNNKEESSAGVSSSAVSQLQNVLEDNVPTSNEVSTSMKSRSQLEIPSASTNSVNDDNRSVVTTSSLTKEKLAKLSRKNSDPTSFQGMSLI
jgi:hypothetical protein